MGTLVVDKRHANWDEKNCVSRSKLWEIQRIRYSIVEVLKRRREPISFCSLDQLCEATSFASLCVTVDYYYQKENSSPIVSSRGRHFTRYPKWHPNLIRKTRTEIWTKVEKYPNGYWIRRDWIPEPKQIIPEPEWISEDNRTYI